jgi:phage shock protein E
MIQRLKKIFGLKPSLDFGEMVMKGAKIIDVRTKEEYSSGHIPESINVPLHDLLNSLKKIEKNKPLIVCCASGMRSASAKNILLSRGYTNVHNGGGWLSLQSKIKGS